MHLRFQKQKNDLFHRENKKTISEIYENLLNEVSVFDDFDQVTFYGLEESAKKGYLYATSEKLDLSISNLQELIDIGVFVTELFEQDTALLNTKSLFALKSAILLSSIERGFFYGYLLSGKSIPKKRKNLFVLPLTGTYNN